MNQSPTISVITAVYNRVTTVQDSIRSLQAQSYPRVEHLIQDGHSTDGTAEVCRALADERTKFVSEPDTGIYEALNKAIARATGDVIGLMHSDDVFASPRALEWVADAFADPAVEAVYGDLQYVSAGDLSRVIRHWSAGEFSHRRLGQGWMPPHPTLYVRREVIERWGSYDTSYHIAADYDAMLRWLGKGGIRPRYIPRVLVKMRMGGESNRSLGRIVLKMREDYRALRSNEIGGLGTLAVKNLSKLHQFVVRPHVSEPVPSNR